MNIFRALPERALFVVTFLFVFLVLAAAPLPAHAIAIKKVVSPGGITAWLVEDRTNPIISVSFEH